MLAGGAAHAQIAPPQASEAERMIEISQVNGSIQAKSVERVGDLVAKNQQESIAILRQYIHSNA